MRNSKFAGLTVTLLAVGLVLPSSAAAQISAHARAKAQVETRDKQHHNKLKTEAIPAAGGAVAGAAVAGPAGAFAGAKMGHTMGSAFHGIKKHRDVKKQQKRNAAVHHRYVSHRRSTRSHAMVRRRQ